MASPYSLDTLIARFKLEIPQVDNVSDDKLRTLAVKAMRRWDNKHFHFNTGVDYFALDDGEYFTDRTTTGTVSIDATLQPVDDSGNTIASKTRKIPFSVLKILDLRVWNGSKWVPLDPATREEIRDIIEDPDQKTGTPDMYCWFNDGLFVAPPPNRALVYRIEAVVDTGIPRPQVDDTGVFSLKEAFSNAAYDSAAPNDWIREADELIIDTMGYLFYSKMLKDSETARDYYISMREQLEKLQETSAERVPRSETDTRRFFW